MFVLIVIVLGLLMSTGVELPALAIERGAVEEILPSMTATKRTALAMVVWVEVIFDVLIVVFGIDLYRILANGQSGLVFAPVAMLAGSGLLIIELLLLLGISQGLAPAYAGATGAEESAIAGAALALLLFRNRLLVVAGVLWSLAAIIFGQAMLFSAEFPGWLGYWGIALGVVGVIAGFFPVYAPLFFVRALGGVLLVLWILIAGIILLRSR